MSILQKLLVTLTLLFSTWAQAYVELETRQPLEVEGGTLSPFWSQEYVGADLAKEILRTVPGLTAVPFSIFDNGFEKAHINLTRELSPDIESDRGRKLTADHGTNVANIINGPGMISMSEWVDFVQLRRVHPGAFYISAIQEISTLPTRPQIISNSMGWPDKRVETLAREMDAQGIIWVLAAGNEHPEAVKDFERTSSVISVGSYSPRGFQTIYSQESTELDILAPADEYQASIDGRGTPGLFGATSGATPMVSGTIANLKALLPSLNRQQAELLLKRTALRSFHQWYSKTNNAGLLNAFKAVRVAIKIRQTCATDAQCIRKEINNRKNYQFAEIAMTPWTFQSCANPSVKLSKVEMSVLRQNYFLNPQDTRFAKLLSCAYRNEGYLINSDYYDTMSLITAHPEMVQRKIQLQAIEAVQKNFTNSSALRDLELMDESFATVLNKALESPTGMGRFEVESLLERYRQVTPIKVIRKAM